MKVIYLLEIELKNWKPHRVLSLTKEYGAFVPTNRETPIQVTETRTVTPRSFLYNALADEYLIKLWPISADDEDKAAGVVKEFTGCGWEEVAAHIAGNWLYLQKRWFVPESLKWTGPHGQAAIVALKETLQESETRNEVSDARPDPPAQQDASGVLPGG